MSNPVADALTKQIRLIEGDDDIQTDAGHLLAGLRDYIFEQGEPGLYGAIAWAWLDGYVQSWPTSESTVQVARDAIQEALNAQH